MAYTGYVRRRYTRRRRTTTTRRPVRRAIVRRRPVRRTRRLPPLTGFPYYSKLVRLRYVEEISLDPVSGGLAYYTFRANSLFDPNLTGSGHQPRGFDQWATLYNHYTVIGAKCSATFLANSTSQVTPGYQGIYLSTSSTDIAAMTTNDVLEGRFNYMNQRSQAPALFWSTNPTVHCRFSAKRFFHRSPLGDNELKASYTANPVEQAYFHIWCTSINGNDPGVRTVKVLIDYLAIMSDPVALGAS